MPTPSTYGIYFTNLAYRWYPWIGSTWADNIAGVNTIDSSTIPSNNLYTVPYDCYVLSWKPKVTWTSTPTSLQGHLDTGNSIAGTNNLLRMYVGDDQPSPYLSAYETIADYNVRNPYLRVRLVKNPTNRNDLGTSIFSSAFPITKVSGVIPTFREVGDIETATGAGMNTAAYQLTAGDKLGIVFYRDADACSAPGGYVLGLWHNFFIDFSYELKLARR